MLIWGLLVLVTGWCFTSNSEGRTGRALWVWRGNRTCGNNDPYSTSHHLTISISKIEDCLSCHLVLLKMKIQFK